MKNYMKHIKPIRNKRDHNDAIKVIEKYFDAKPGTIEAELMEILSILVDHYEEEKFPIEAPTPNEAIKFRMEQLGMTTGDLALLLGGRNRVSEIFNKRRQLSLSMIRKLNKELNIPAESLIHAA